MEKTMNRTALIVPVIVQVACTADPNFEMFTCKDAATTNCVEIPVEEADELLVTVNSLLDDTTVVLGKGTFTYDLSLIHI